VIRTTFPPSLPLTGNLFYFYYHNDNEKDEEAELIFNARHGMGNKWSESESDASWMPL